MRTKSYQTRVNAIIGTAQNLQGYRAKAQRVNIYGAAVAADGQPWAGAFLEVLMRDCGERGLPNLTHTSPALAEFVRRGQIFRVPKEGDLVFFGYSTDGPFAQPHIGLVTDVTGWKADGTFLAVSGQQRSPHAKGPQESDGVYERKHYNTEVLAFARPKYGKLPEKTASDTVPAVHPLTEKPSSITAIQLALSDTVGARGLTRGKLDRATVVAIESYQRKIGFPVPSGKLDETTVRRLALDTGYRYFKVA